MDLSGTSPSGFREARSRESPKINLQAKSKINSLIVGRRQQRRMDEDDTGQSLSPVQVSGHSLRWKKKSKFVMREKYCFA